MLPRKADARGASIRGSRLASAGVCTLAALAVTSVAISGSSVHDPGMRSGPPGAGDPLPGLTAGQIAAFKDGKAIFAEIESVENPPEGGGSGLGPLFNSDSCESCHAQPASGGSSPALNPQIEAATRSGATNTIPWFISEKGPVREVRFISAPDGSPDGGVHDLFVIAGRADARGCDIAQEDFSNRSNLSFRVPTPAFGAGLLEAIPDFALIANLNADSDAKARVGIAGKLNRSGNDGSITRFGWKAQNKSLMIFSAEAYNVEMGVTNMIFPQERNETSSCMYNATPEDSTDFDRNTFDDIVMLSVFMRFLAPPARGPSDDSVKAGERVFKSVGCALCHTPSLSTGRSGVAALSNKSVPLFSDLALHHMGLGLADRISQGRAGGDEFRTAPLWGLGQRIFFLHDGRTTDLLEAIRAHMSPAGSAFPPSEANAVVQQFNGLTAEMQQHLLNFLRSL